MQTAPNHLAKERSPYLKSAAHQPVRWFPWSPEAFREAQRLERPILLARRRRRKTPFVDPTLYTHWNGLWIRAFFTASRYLGESSLKDFALRTLTRFKDEGYHREKGMTRFLDSTGNFHEGLLEDQTEMPAAALLRLYHLTREPGYLERARSLFRYFYAEQRPFPISQRVTSMSSIFTFKDP